jgi:hypothetical protein
MRCVWIRVVRLLVGGALSLGVVLFGTVSAPIARATEPSWGVGLKYAYPIQYVKICGDNQNGQPICTPVDQVDQPSSAQRYQTVWFVTNTQLTYGANPPSTRPGYWWRGPVHIWTWSSYLPNPIVSTGDTVCTVDGANAQGDWQRCAYLIPTLPPPTEPSPPTQPAPPTGPTPQPTPTSPGQPAGNSAAARVEAEYHRVLSAEIFGPARAVCSQLTASGARAYTGDTRRCAQVFAGNRRTLRLKLGGVGQTIRRTALREAIGFVLAHLSVTVRGHRASVVDSSGIFRRARLVELGRNWKFSSAPPLPMSPF